MKSGYYFVYSLNENFGVRIYLGTKGYIEGYAGVGGRVKVKNVQITSRCQYCNMQELISRKDDSQPYKREIQVLPSISLGFRVGISF